MTDSTELLAFVREARAAGDASRLVARVPYARFLGLSLEANGDVLLAKMAYSDSLVGNPALPALHGGTLGALLESVAIFQVMWASESVVLPKTISITVDFLRSARPVDTFARGVITKRGRRVTNVRAEAWQDDATKPVAAAHCHFLVMDE
ncbi:MAG: PaaI family thioesterase [Myxococcales bacterium]|nr:PaaI family thioesterase [Myxococcales bacterium]